MAELRGGSTVAGYQITHGGNFKHHLTTEIEERMVVAVEKVTKTQIDAKGYYQTVEYRRGDNTLSAKSVASLPNADGKYTRLTVTLYGEDGTSVKSTDIRTITYDAFGNVQRIQ